MEDSEVGHVLFNKKPVCITGYESKDLFNVWTLRHKEAVSLKEGVAVWKKISKSKSDISFHVTQNLDPQLSEYTHILVIDEPLFHETINKNISLFQYVLGIL